MSGNRITWANRITRYGYGLPFLVKKNAQDGLPIEDWDGTTRSPPSLGSRPSKSSSEQIDVISSIGIPLARAYELFYRVSRVSIDVSGLSVNADGEVYDCSQIPPFETDTRDPISAIPRPIGAKIEPQDLGSQNTFLDTPFNQFVGSAIITPANSSRSFDAPVEATIYLGSQDFVSNFISDFIYIRENIIYPSLSATIGFGGGFREFLLTAGEPQTDSQEVSARLDIDTSRGETISAPLYSNGASTSGPITASGAVKIKAIEWWPYANNAAQPVWNSATGQPINGGPFS